jgi:hypothetical protein
VSVIVTEPISINCISKFALIPFNFTFLVIDQIPYPNVTKAATKAITPKISTGKSSFVQLIINKNYVQFTIVELQSLWMGGVICAINGDNLLLPTFKAHIA